MEFFHSVVAQDITESDGSKTYDLAIRPLSHLAISIKCLNKVADTKATLAQILAALEKIEVLRFGASIVSISALDLYALNTVLLGHEPWQENVLNTEECTRCLTLIVPFGRKLYDPKECFPGRTAGELQLKLQIDVDETYYDGYISQIHQVELVGASPTKYLKYATKDYTPSATGDGEVDLPRGNVYAGILLWGTTVPTTTSWDTTIDRIKLLVNNEEKYFSSVNWETLHGELVNRCDPAGSWSEKIHVENAATAYTQSADTAGEEQVNTALVNHSYMDFSPGNRDDFLLSTVGLTGLKLGIYAGVASEATRITPIELVNV